MFRPLLAVAFLAVPAFGAEPPASFKSTAEPLLKSYCVRCHNPNKAEGGVDLTAADDAAALAKRNVWKRSLGRVAAGEMPPEESKQMTPADKAALSKWLGSAGTYLDCDPTRRDPGPPPLRRLTRTEYEHTVRDLLGVSINTRISVGMPEEDPGEGHFDNLSAALRMSPALADKYFTAADKVIDLAFVNDSAKNRLLTPKPDAKVSERDAATQVLTTLARRAYRRPPEPADVARLMGFYDKARGKGGSHEDGVKAAMKPVLVSPNFLFRVEQDRPATGTAPGVAVDDYELATRLSYFLWSSMPDDELFRVAAAKKLSDPVEYEKQVARMLKHRSARELTAALSDHWIGLKHFEKARPTQEFFPTFNQGVRRGMQDEVRAFVDNLRTEDRPVTDLLDADYTFVNADLAKFYGISGPAGRDAKKVPLKPEDHRGGLLGMGAVLAMTSHTFRTSPTQRGKYVLDVIFGTPPPPPPANVGTLKNDDPKDKKKAVVTFKDQLAQHATQAGCAGCHKKIDPLGFALDNYNAVGLWREGTKEFPLDTTGVLPTGETVNGVGDLKKVILSRKDEFAKNMAAKVLEFALGRELDGQDECTVNEVHAAMQKSGYKFSTLVLETTKSVPFRQRRGVKN